MTQKLLPEPPEKTRQHVEGRENGLDPAPSFQRELHPVVHLQRVLGNRGVAKLIQAKRLTRTGKIIGLQHKLTVGAADDQYEQEADRVAHQVMNTPDTAVAANYAQRSFSSDEDKDQMLQTKPLIASITPFMQRQTMNDDELGDKEQPVPDRLLKGTGRMILQRQPEAEDEEKEFIQAKSAGSMSDSFEAGDDVETLISNSKGLGRPLPDPVRAFMEPRFGVDFSHVHVHTGSDAGKMSRAVGAQAFTHGSDIYFGASHGPGNLELTAHELTHVIQQTGGGPILTNGAFVAQRQTSKFAKEENQFGSIASGQNKMLAAAKTPLVQAKCAACAQEDEDLKKNNNVQRKPLTSNTETMLQEDEDEMDRKLADSVESRLTSTKGRGDSLPDQVRMDMESAFSADFSGVKIHTDQSAIQMNQNLGAKAFTHENNIYFNSGYYHPSSSSGKKLLAHELTHVVQQTGGDQQQKAQTGNKTRKVTRIAKKDILQLAPNVTALNGPAEMPAGQGSRVTLRANAARGTVIAWSGATNGTVLGAGTGRTNTLTAPAGSTGGVITVQAADAANLLDVATLNITLVEIQQPTFAFAPPMPAFAPANTMDASVCGNNATAAAVTVPAGRPVTWSIVGERRGAAIDPATGVITPSATQTGNIRVRATDNALPAARNEQILTIQAHPTGISRTQIAPGGFPLGTPYGAIYTHAFRSSGGTIANVMVTERVFCGNGPFSCAGLPVVPGNLNAPAGALQDTIGTPSGLININNFLPSPPNPGLPQVMDTPQILYWRSDQCSPAAAAPPAAAPGDHWVPFVNVPIKATLLRRGANFFFQTSDNGVATPLEPYIGTALAAGPAPAASACAAGEGVSNIRFNPGTIAADASAMTTTAATAQVLPGGTLITWSFPGPNFGANIVAQGNPALFSAGNIAGQVRVRAALTATPACFTEGWLRMQEVEIGPAIRFSPGTVRSGGTTRATVTTKPGSRAVTWSIIPPALGAVIVRNPDNSATITAGAQVGRVTVRATDQRDVTKFAEASLIIN